ncbi:WD repeat-containing protein 89 [Sitophilus oryzae]|uniref:WD repeat-containing protein 89 n=1 Tax=Sitophilus oryzae TaxID=7048 RepID=A0A6J2YEN6_SITOR|nr:WD repeat-containing protein 89 [Sitophilus oryzae]
MKMHDGKEHDSDNESGSDTCDISEVNESLSNCEHVHVQPVGSQYILHISATREVYPYIAAALSDHSTDVFCTNESGLEKITRLSEHTKRLVDCKFVDHSNNLLYTASNDGTIKLWDLREFSKSVTTFNDTTLNEPSTVRCFNSFDVAPCNRIIAAGTEFAQTDAFILFWDVRNTKLLGAYWESHSDDITQVKFKPSDTNTLMSGSTDGLINIYNLSESREEDAFTDCFNTDGFVDNLQWFEEDGKTRISCITSTIELQLWDVDSAEKYKHIDREDLGNIIKGTTDNTYLASVHQIQDSLFVLAGSKASQGYFLYSFQVKNGEYYPAFRFDNSRQRVRASWLNTDTNLLITGGESGKLDLWRPDLSTLNYKTKRK